jgi:MYXO-CTERM domain-containing protein
MRRVARMLSASRSLLVAAGIGVSCVLVAKIAVGSDFTIPEYKLLGSELAATSWGGSVVVTDAPGEAVQFTFSGLDGSGTGVKDDYPVDTVYGQNLPSHGNGDFSSFSGYALRFTNLDSESISVSLFINTGFTGPSGDPSNDTTNDTFWQSAWTEIPAGQSTDLRLDFDSAIPWGIDDNKDPHTTGGSDGVAGSINAYDRTELSAIGFEVGSENNPDATILITPIPQPASLPGDANGDGAVSDADYTLWADHYGAIGATFAMGDFNGDGEVTDADYTIWADHYGQAAGDVPEPGAMALLSLGAAALRRRRMSTKS